MERIVVTGMGILSAIGCGQEETWTSLSEGRSGIGRLKLLPTTHNDLPCGEVAMDDHAMKAMLHLPEEEVMTRTGLMGLVALCEALSTAHITQRDGRRIAFVNGTTVGGMDLTERYYTHLMEDHTHDECIALHECGACTEEMDKHTGHLFSYVTTLSTACSSAANAIALAARLLKSGIADIAVAGGSECLTKFHLNGFNSLMILDHEPCRPFDDTRSGLNLGEGAAYLVLEKEKSAEERGATPLAVLSGYGNACDAFHQTATSDEGLGVQLSMQKALAISGLQPADIDYINVHGTGTPNNDITEGRAIQALFGQHLPAFSSTKAMTGHTTSASGSIEAVISILALLHDFVPASLRFHTPMNELPLRPVAHGERRTLHHVLSNSCGFGGNCTSLVLSKIEGGRI